MKPLSLYFFALLTLMLSACSGSDSYRGDWKATASDGSKYNIHFDPKKFTVKDTTGNEQVYDYTQHSVNINNSIETYGITLGDGRVYEITFPIANDQTVGLIKDQNNKPLFTISRNKYTMYEEVFGLN